MTGGRLPDLWALTTAICAAFKDTAMRIEYHRTLIADDVRMDHLHAALKRLIVPGESVVADIGTGTGVLAVMAAKLGAREIVCYESEGVGAVAEATLHENGITNACVFPCSSLEIDDPPRADIVISETLGNYAFEENIIDTLVDARSRHLKAGGVLLPRRVSQFVAPVVSRRFLDALRHWERLEALGISMLTARDMSLNNVYVRAFNAQDLLGGMASTQRWDDVSFDGEHAVISGRRSKACSWVITDDLVERSEAPASDGAGSVTINGLCVWWEADFGLDAPLSTAPDAPVTHWEQLYFPTLPLTARAGDTLLARLEADTGLETGTDFTWQLALRGADGEVGQLRDMSLDKGYLP